MKGLFFLSLVLIISFLIISAISPVQAMEIEKTAVDQTLVFSKNSKISGTLTITSFDVVPTEWNQFIVLAKSSTNKLYIANGTNNVGYCSDLALLDESGSIYNDIQAYAVNFGSGRDADSIVMFYNQGGYVFASYIKDMSAVNNKTSLFGSGYVSTIQVSEGQSSYDSYMLYYISATWSDGRTEIYSVKFTKVVNAITLSLSSNHIDATTEVNERIEIFETLLFNSSATPTAKYPYAHELSYNSGTNQLSMSAGTKINGWYGYSVCKVERFSLPLEFYPAYIAILANTSNLANIGYYNGSGWLDSTPGYYGQADTTNDFLYGLDGYYGFAAFSVATQDAPGKEIVIMGFNSGTDYYTMYSNATQTIGYSHVWIYAGILNMIHVTTGYAVYFLTTYSVDDDPFEYEKTDIAYFEGTINNGALNKTTIAYFEGYMYTPTTEFYLAVFGLIWLLVTFLPAIIINQVIPKIGFVSGIVIMTIVLGLTMENYFFVTVIALIACAFIIIRGDG